MKGQSSRFILLAAVALLLLSSPGWAQDPPHWASVNLTIDCTSQCHALHQAAGAGLTGSASNVNLCMSCHTSSGDAADLSMYSVDSAVPGTSGTSHAFDVASTGMYDVTVPSDTDMSQMETQFGNQVVCSTCHDQHKAESSFGGTPRISSAKQITALGSDGVVSSGGAYTGTQGNWFLVEISNAGPPTVRFQYSRDNGGTWFPEQDIGAGVALGADGVTASFSGGTGNYVLGERYQFYAAYPFLRRKLHDPAQDSALCLECHNAWNMDFNGSRTYVAAPGAWRSHPVGVALGDNGEGYDRGSPLDADGSADDGNASNDLILGNQGVQCLTCHGVHNADSNSNTVDGP